MTPNTLLYQEKQITRPLSCELQDIPYDHYSTIYIPPTSMGSPFPLPNAPQLMVAGLCPHQESSRTLKTIPRQQSRQVTAFCKLQLPSCKMGIRVLLWMLLCRVSTCLYRASTVTAPHPFLSFWIVENSPSLPVILESRELRSTLEANQPKGEA